MNGRDLTLGLVALSAAGTVATRFARAGQRNVPADELASALANAAARIGPEVRPVLAAGTYLQLRALANAVKSGSTGALRQAAERMAPLVPNGADLVPIPSSSGSTDANRVLVDAIAARAAELGVACRVVDALTGDPRPSSLKKKRAGEPSLLARQMRTRASPGRQALQGSTRVLLVDNVIATGATARAAAQALDFPGRVGILALAVTSDPSAAARESWATTWKTPLGSPWFSRWFQDSRVVDAEGQPLVAWHGQAPGTPDFDAFDFDRAIDLGMHFGTREAARVVSNLVRPYYLSIQRPLELDDPGDWISGPSYAGTNAIRAHTGISTLDQLVAQGVCTPGEVQSVADRIHAMRKKNTGDPASMIPFTRYRVEAGRLIRALIASFDYDGVVYENHSEHWGSRSWIAFHPEQIKSAWPPDLEPLSRANVGTFSPEDPRVSANRATPAYPGPTLVPGASLDAVADAYLALRRAVPDPILLRVLHDFATADLDNLPHPGLESFDKHAYFMSPEGVAKHLRAGDFPDMARLLVAMPGAWTDAVAMTARVRARKKVAAAAEARKQAADARWEGQGVVLDPWSMPPARQLRGKEVWLYHGTTSRFLPRILRDGLVPGDEPPRRKRLRRQDRKSNTSNVGDRVRYQPHVFLTANDDGHASSASWYARGAAATHGGDPVILRVLVPWDDLGPDPDDADIASGRYQFVIDRVPPEAILEVDGKRRKPRKNA